MSAVAPKADKRGTGWFVREVPEATDASRGNVSRFATDKSMCVSQLLG
jgi:hypothetical protein